jgi:indole-3-glycerol phosphate synthase
MSGQISKPNILEQIIADKHKEVAFKKERWPAKSLIKSPYFTRATESLVRELNDAEGTGIITEFKRKSPSKGIINGTADCVATTSMYELYGAAGISILTDKKYFGGSSRDIYESRESLFCPVLRKDFIIHEYQLLEAKAMGADVILLIAANLSVQDTKRLAGFAKSLKLEVLLELHAENELDHVCAEVDMVGINNRNLKNFEVDLEHSIRLAEKLPADKPKIAESGIDNVETVVYLRQQGFKGFLMGERFMKHADPAIAFADFVKQLADASSR